MLYLLPGFLFSFDFVPSHYNKRKGICSMFSPAIELSLTELWYFSLRNHTDSITLFSCLTLYMWVLCSNAIPRKRPFYCRLNKYHLNLGKIRELERYGAGQENCLDTSCRRILLYLFFDFPNHGISTTRKTGWDRKLEVLLDFFFENLL